MKRRIHFLRTVRVRLTLWYLTVMACILLIFGGSLYASQAHFNNEAVAHELETALYQDARELEARYKESVQDDRAFTVQPEKLAGGDFVMLFRPDRTLQESYGVSLPTTMTRYLQASLTNNQPLIDYTLPQPPSQEEWHENYRDQTTYRVLTIPILDQNMLIATLMIGGLKENSVAFLHRAWIFHGIFGLLAAAVGGFWLAGKVLAPIKMITRTANEINATDLRRRLNLKRRDEFGELAATFDQMLGRLDAAFRRQTQFTADASHELRTPLTIIDLETNRALTQLQTLTEYRQVMELVRNENEQMTAIVNSLLLLARADTGQITLDYERVDLSDIALSCVERLLSLAEKGNITLSTGDLPELIINGDPHYLGQMTINLLENAIKYTQGIGKRVHVELTEREDQAIMRIQDDGPGIAEDCLPYLFDRFYRVDKARTHSPQEDSDWEEPGGTGLGLSIVQWIAQAHHGEVIVESKPGKGTIFEVCLPLLKQEEGEDAKKQCL